MKILFWIVSMLLVTIYKGDTTNWKNRRSNRRNEYVQKASLKIIQETPKPNLTKTGLRISESKCLEYILELKNRNTIKGFPTVSPELQSLSAILTGTFHIAEVGGRDAEDGEFPHMGALGWRAKSGTWIFKCGSSLISPKFTLTAAHCSKIPSDPSIANQVPEIVRLGDKNIIDTRANGVEPTDAKILRIIVHPKYSSRKKYYDIALVELVTELRFSRNVQPVCLWSKFDTSKLGSKVSSTGWGVVDTATKKTSPILQAIEIEVVNSNACNHLLRNACDRKWCGLQDHQLCAGKLEGGVDACQGDSGGPLQVKTNLSVSEEGPKHYLIGVTSFGIGCARSNLPGVYTRVSSFIDWIENIVWHKRK